MPRYFWSICQGTSKLTPEEEQGYRDLWMAQANGQPIPVATTSHPVEQCPYAGDTIRLEDGKAKTRECPPDT